MDTEIHFRLAVVADIPRLSELLGLLFTQEADFRPDTERQMRGLDLILAQPGIGSVYCATDGREIRGMVSLLFTVSTAEGGRVAWMEDLIVHPDWRGCGIGDQLLRHAVSEARAAGCLRITLLTDASNSTAQRLYSRAGFASSKMVPMRMVL